jgi:putative heme transporter
VTQPNPEFRPSQVTLKTVLVVCFGVIMSAALVDAVAHALLSITLVGLAIMIAIALDHGVDWLAAHRVPRPLAIVLVSVALVGLIVGFAFLLIPPAIDQGKELLQQVPQIVRSARRSAIFRTLDSRFHIARHVGDAEQRLPDVLGDAATPILNAIGGILSGVGALVTVIFLVIFMLIFGGRLLRGLLAEARPQRLPMYKHVLGKIYQSIGGYLGGLAFICGVNATMTTTFLAIDRVPFFLPLGILAGTSSMVPYAGPLVMGTAITLIALVTKGFWHFIAAGIYFVLYGQFEGNFLSPFVFRRTVHVNPLITMLSILFLGEIAGVIGAVAAVPVIATAQIVIREILQTRREQLYGTKAARPSDPGDVIGEDGAPAKDDEQDGKRPRGHRAETG